MASDLPFCNIFAPQKVPLSKIFDDVIACDLLFTPPNQKSWLRLCCIPACLVCSGEVYANIVIVITFHSLGCLGQETAKEPLNPAVTYPVPTCLPHMVEASHSLLKLNVKQESCDD